MRVHHRTHLSRRWAESGPMGVFIMLNPSTADDHENDPTIRRCIGFAKQFGWSGFRVANLFTMRATKPRDLYAMLKADPDKANDTFANVVLAEAFEEAEKSGDQVVAAWGKPGHRNVAARASQVQAMASIHGATLWCLGTNKDGSPKHPLYLRADSPLVVYRP